MGRLVHLKAFTNDVKLAQDSIENYKQEFTTLVNYATQIKGYIFPLPHDINAWPGGAAAYQAAQTTWADIGGTLEGWSISTLKNIIKIPEALTGDNNTIILPALNACISLCDDLISDPNDQLYTRSLKRKINLLIDSFDMYSDMTEGLIKSLNDEATVFDNDAGKMIVLSNQALDAVGNDNKRITELNNQISKLNSDIKSAAVAIAGGSLVTVAGLGICIVGIILAPATGGVSLGLLIPGLVITAGGVVCIALNSMTISQDKKLIDALNTQINSIEGDITLLTQMSDKLKGFAGQVDSLKNTLSVITKPWSSACDYFKSTLETLNTIEDATSEDWTNVKNELNDILTHWNTLIDTVGKIQVQFDVYKTNLSLGMSQDEVMKAINDSSANKVDIITYLIS
ncbi:hypothetical protein [Clostridium sp. HBUAS56017]|uniref:hypothetical protein n=1 Tax=Clostridium sp. HBUAS56017 TaxID=2571128 RepID=UPI0011783943|nr:hypothetical protein [Clostridium sp. HBUAS56017]